MSELFEHAAPKASRRAQRSESPVAETNTAASHLADAETLTSESEIRFESGSTENARPLREPKANLPAVVSRQTANGEAAKPISVDEFNWNEEESIVFHEQTATAVYRSANGNVVIRQRANWPDEIDDPYFVILESNLQAFIDSLCDLAGIQSFGRPDPAVRKKR